MLPHYLVKCTIFSSFSIFHVYQVPPIRDMDELRKRLVATWAEFQQSVVDDAVDQWRKNWKHVSVQKFVTLNTCCNVAWLIFHLPHITTGSSQTDQCQPTTGFFSEPPTFGGMPYTFSQIKKLCILQGSVVTFLGVVGKGVTICFLQRRCK